MVINVGLLVHHKINLQNSVDMAAYYGAMKQSEVMNAIAHINYQIRQSYKLLTWRYRVLGTAGVMHITQDGKDAHPVIKGDQGGGDIGRGVRGGTIAGGTDYEGISPDGSLRDYYERPAFCVAFRPFNEIPSGENTCREPAGQTIPALRRPPIIAGFIGAAHTAQRVTDLANLSQQHRCQYVGPYNYAMLGKFIVSYNLDQGAKKMLIYKLANGLSHKTDNFSDLEGGDAIEGIRKTLEGNLTVANREGMQPSDMQMYNGLGHADCRQTSTDTEARPPKWLSEVAIFPRASYKMCRWSGGSIFDVRNIDEPPDNIVNVFEVPAELRGIIDYLKNYISPPGTGRYAQLAPSLGVEKNPWCMAYVGVRAETTPALPFSLGAVKLKAVAFAKPFGGRIGPWYGKTWPRSAEESQGNGEATRSDPRTPVRCPLGNRASCSVQGQDAVTTVNYSRFPGDRWGMMSRAVHGQYGKSVLDMGNPSFNIWRGIETEPSSRGGDWDILSWDAAGPETKMRKLEIAAVAPDIFDLTYYSIEPEFYKNYYKDRLEKFLQKYPVSSDYVPRMDIGSKAGSLVGFSIRNQIATVARLRNTSANQYGIDFNSKLPYMLADAAAETGDYFAKVLTSWVPPNDIMTYDFKPDEKFGKCGSQAAADVPVPGSCEGRGGRAGYSVKLISSDYLLDNQEVGGTGSSTDRIKNLPPPEFYQ